MWTKLTLPMKIVIAVLLDRLRRGSSGRPVLLVGGHEGKLFTDNGRAFYLFLRREHPEYDVHWVTNHDSPDVGVPDVVVRRGSIRNFLLYLRAEGVFFSHSGSDVAPVLHRLVKRGPVRFFIEHGVVGLKRAKLSGLHTGTRLGPVADLYVSVSSWEKSIKVDEWRLPDADVQVTGLPRYDDLVRREPSRLVVYIPTWREWLYESSAEEFQGSDFRRILRDVMTSEEIASVLEDAGARMVVYPHFYLHKHLSGDPEAGAEAGIELAAPTADVQQALLDGAVLVTDYSSVAWDFGYLGKPVLFHQPDLDRYLAERGSYLDLPDDLFGAQSVDASQLAENLASALSDPSASPTTATSWRSKYFAHEDRQNSARVFEAFRQRLADRRSA